MGHLAASIAAFCLIILNVIAGYHVYSAHYLTGNIIQEKHSFEKQVKDLQEKLVRCSSKNTDCDINTMDHVFELRVNKERRDEPAFQVGSLLDGWLSGITQNPASFHRYFRLTSKCAI